MRHLLLSAACLSVFATSAGAQCPTTADVVFSGTSTTGYDAGTSGVSILVTPGADVSGASHGIKTGKGQGVTVSNCGTLTGLSKDGINADGAGLTVLNEGTIRGADDGIQGADLMTVLNHGTIEAADEGVTAGDFFTLTNTGTITGRDDAVQVGNHATIVNAGRIENLGTDPADPQDAIDLDSGTVINLSSGVIRSTLDAAIDFDASDIASTIVNHGLISGTTGVLVEKDPAAGANIAAQFIDNLGTIEGTGGLALDLGAGADTLRMSAGARLVGGIDMGDDGDSLIFTSTLSGPVAQGATLFGGAGTDTARFLGYALADIVSAALAGEVLTLSLFSGGQTASVALSGWEVFGFGTAVYSRDQILAAVAPVPLPAAGLLLVAGIGGLAALRRRARA